MLKDSHIFTNLAIVMTSYTISHHTKILNELPVLAGVYCGSILPDIDHPNTQIYQQFPRVGQFINQWGHRGITHSILGFIIITTPIFGLLNLPSNLFTTILTTYWFGLILGYLGHLIEDNLSIQGILWLWPFTHYQINQYGHAIKNRPYSKYYYRVGGVTEHWIRWFATLIVLINFILMCIGI